MPVQDLLFTVDTSINTLLTVELDIGLSYSGVINWGDGSAETILNGVVPASVSHTFATVNTFQIRVTGTQVPRFELDDQSNIVSVENLGNIGLQDTLGMFTNCNNITNASVGGYVTILDNQIFTNCTSLISITIPNAVTSIGQNAFFNTSLTNVNFPNSANIIQLRTFMDCTELISVNIPSSVTLIGSEAFRNCTSLTSIVIPSGITAFFGYTFADCTSLGSISCLATSAPALNTAVFFNVLATSINVPVGATDYGTTYGGLTVNYVL
jgi:hypothetical protein